MTHADEIAPATAPTTTVGATAAAATAAATAAAASVRPATVPDLEQRTLLRGVFGMFATGITVLTAQGRTAHGMTANSFTSVSLTPPLALICVKRDAEIHDAIVDRRSFAVSMLHSSQESVARHFANHKRPRGEEEFAVVDASPGPRTGAPILNGALAWLECELAAVYEGGDHSIFLGSVLQAGRSDCTDEALLFYGGAFHQLRPEASNA